jgi:multidrug resistance efflux pump
MRLSRLEERSTRPAPPAERKRKEQRQRRRVRIATLSVGGVLALVVLAMLVTRSLWVVTTGRVVAARVDVGAAVTGRIATLEVEQGAEVEAGQVLARLDTREVEAQLAAARLEQQRAAARIVARREAGIEPQTERGVDAARIDRVIAGEQSAAAGANLAAARTALEQAAQARTRAERLLMLRAITRAEFDAAELRYAEAEAAFEVLLHGERERQSALDGADVDLSIADADRARDVRLHERELVQLELAERQAELDIERLQARLDASVIRAPRAGRVGWIHRLPGESIDHSDPVVTLVDTSDVWIEAYVRARDLVYMQPGTRAGVVFDGLDSKRYRGEVVLSAAGTGDASLGPAAQQRILSAAQLDRILHPIRVRLEELPEGVLPDMTVKVRLSR